MLFLNEADVEKLVSMSEAFNVIEKAFQEYATGAVVMPPRSTIMMKRFNGSVSLMPAYLKETNALTTKIIAIYPKNPERGLPTSIAWIIVNDPETGMIEALIEATRLTAVRTGAVTGVAARYLAPRDSREAAVIGCGAQGLTQAWAVAEAFPLDCIKLFDISRERATRLANELESKIDADIIISESAEDAVKKADIVATATTSKEPVIRRKWLGDEVHVSAIGSFYPDHRELDTETIREAKIVVDSREAVLAEAGDLIIPIKEGAITEKHIYAELGDIVTCKKKGRTNRDKLTVFKSVGLAIQDSAIANLILKRAREA